MTNTVERGGNCIIYNLLGPAAVAYAYNCSIHKAEEGAYCDYEDNLGYYSKTLS